MYMAIMMPKLRHCTRRISFGEQHRERVRTDLILDSKTVAGEKVVATRDDVGSALGASDGAGLEVAESRWVLRELAVHRVGKDVGAVAGEIDALIFVHHG